MRCKTIFLGIFMASLSFQSSAVDGYKGVKFGVDIKTVLSSKWCNFHKYEGKTQKGLQSYYCTDFKFSGSDTLAMVIFLDGKFERLAVSLDSGVEALTAALEKKYGKPSSTSTPEEGKKVLAQGGSLYIRYDNDTVLLVGTRDISSGQDTSQLIYSSTDYDKKIAALEAKNIEGDL